MVIDPLNRDESPRANGRNPTTTRKCMAVTVTASSSRPDAAAMPMAADSHTAAAVVSPWTEPRRKMMMPAPRKPMPETLSGDTRWVDDDESVLQDVSEAVLADKKDQRGRGADDRLRADACALALDLALEADQCGQPERDEQLDNLTDALSRSAEERRIGGQPDVYANKLAPRRTCHGDRRAVRFASRRSEHWASTRQSGKVIPAAGVAEWLGTGLQSRLHGFESRHSLVCLLLWMLVRIATTPTFTPSKRRIKRNLI